MAEVKELLSTLSWPETDYLRREISHIPKKQESERQEKFTIYF